MYVFGGYPFEIRSGPTIGRFTPSLGCADSVRVPITFARYTFLRALCRPREASPAVPSLPTLRLSHLPRCVSCSFRGWRCKAGGIASVASVLVGGYRFGRLNIADNPESGFVTKPVPPCVRTNRVMHPCCFYFVRLLLGLSSGSLLSVFSHAADTAQPPPPPPEFHPSPPSPLSTLSSLTHKNETATPSNHESSAT